MTDPTRPITRVRRPTLAAPVSPLQEAADLDQAAHHAETHDAEQQGAREEFRRDAEFAASVGEELADAPPAPVRSEIRREGHAVSVKGFIPRAGDVLVVAYGEVTLPLPKQFAMVRFGGYTYTHQLEAGDDVDERARAISQWLSQRAEADGVAKYARLAAEIKKADR